MNQATTPAPAQTPPPHPPAATATSTRLSQPPPATASDHDHLAAAAYLMKHTGTTALTVTDTRTGQPAGIITAADITRAIADGKNPNNIRIHAIMTTPPATTTRGAPQTTTAKHPRHQPATSDTGPPEPTNITDPSQAPSNTGNR